MADYNIDVDVKIDTSKLDAAKKEIDNLDNKKIGIQIDVNGKDIINQLERNLKNTKAKVIADVDYKIDNKKLKSAMSSLTSGMNIGDKVYGKNSLVPLAKQMESQIKSINSMLISPKVNDLELEEMINQLEKTKNEYNKVKQLFNGDFSENNGFTQKMRNQIRDIDQDLANLYRRMEAREIDLGIAKEAKQEEAEAKAIYNRIKTLRNELYTRQKDVIGLDKGSLVYEEQAKNINMLESEIDRLMAKLRGFDSSITGNMFDRLSASAQKAARELNVLEGKNIELGIAKEIKQEETEAKAALDDLANTYKRIMNLSKQQASLDVDSSEYKVLESEMNRLAQKAVELRSKISGPLPDSFLDNFAEDSVRTRADIDRTIARIEDARRKMADAFANKIKNGALDSDLEQLATRIDKIANKTPELTRAYEQLKNLRSEFGNALSKYQQTGNIDELLKFQNKYNEALDVTKHRLQANQAIQEHVANETKKQVDLTKFESSKKTFDLQIQSWLKTNSAAAADFGDQLESIRARIRQCNDSASLNNLKSEFQQVKLEAQIADKATMTFGDRLKNQIREYSSYIGIATVFMEGMQAARAMAQSVLEVDTAMTGLYRVTDLTSAQYDKLYSDMIASSKEYGTTLTDTINATADWVRAGFDADTSLGLADITAMYQHVSDLDYDEASENLLTAYNGFKDSFNTEFGGDAIASVEHIADAFNELDNKYSVTSAGLGEGLSRSASALQLAGNTFEEAAAMIGATTEVTQNPEKAGNAMKVLSLRLRGMKGELEELGEDSEGVENISKMQGQILNLTKGRVNIFGDNGEFKSTYDIMKDIAGVYDELTDTERASLLETIAGKDRANDVASLLSNFDTAIKMVETAENSAGSARGENEKYLDSLQGRLDVMTSSLQAFSSAAMDSSLLKGGVSSITALIDGITVLVENIGLIPTVLGAAGAALGIFGKGIVTIDKSADGLLNKFNLFGKSISNIGKSFSEGFSAFSSGFETNKQDGLFAGLKGGMDSILTNAENPFKKFQQQMDIDLQAFEKYQNRLAQGMSGDALTNALAGSSDELQKNIAMLSEGMMSWDEFVDSQKQSAVAIQASSKGLKSSAGIIKEYNSGCKNIGMTQKAFAKAVSATNPTLGSYLSGLNGANATMGGYAASLIGATAKTVALTAASTALNAVLTMGIGVAITAVISGIASLITYYDDLAKSVEESSTAFQTSNDKLMQNKSSYESAVQSYDKLSKGVNKLGENVSLSTSEYEEYQSAVNTIADSAPNMVAGFDAQGNAILKASANAETLTKAYNDLIAAESRAFLKGDEDKGYVGLDKIAEDYAHDLQSLNWYNDTAYKHLDEIMSSSNIDDAIKKLSDTDLSIISHRLEKIGLDKGSMTNAQFIADAIRNDTDTVRAAVDDYMAEYDAMASDMNQAAQAMLNEAFYGDADLSDVNNSVKNMVSQYVAGFDSAFYDELIKNSGGDKGKVGEYLESYMNDLTADIGKLSEAQQKTIADAFNMQGDFESGNVSMDEFAKKAQEVDSIFKEIGLDEGARKEMMLSLGFEYDDENNLKKWTSDYETALNRVQKETGIDKTKLDDWLGDLSGGELGMVMSMELDGVETIDELQQALDLAKALNGIGSIDISFETDSLEKLNTAIQESNGAMGLSQDSIESVKARYSDLAGYDPAAIFEKTTTGIRLNEEALASLEKQYVNTNKAAAQQDIDTLVQEYKAIQELRDKAAAGSDDRARYDAQLDDLEGLIQDAQMAASAYDGLTSAYNRWINAQSGGEEGDMYDNVVSAAEQMNEYASQGLFGRNDVQSYADMFFGEGVTDDWDADAYSAHWQEVVDTQNRYLTEGREGAENFINDIRDEFLQLNSEGDLELKPNVEIEDIAKSLGKSNAFVEMMLGKANDYGFEFKIGVDQKSVDELVSESEAAAKQAQESLQQYLGKDFEIDYSVQETGDGTNNAVSKLETLKAQRDEINNSDATVEVKEQGVAAVNSAIQTVIAQKLELEQPAFMSLDVSNVDASMQDALTKAQEMQAALNELSNLQLQAKYGVIDVDDSRIDDAQAKVDNLAQAIADNGDLKVKLGIDENAGIDEVKAAFSPENIGEMDVKFGADTSKAESDIAGLELQDKTVDVQVNLTGDDKITALESKMNAIDNKTIDATVSLTGDDKIAALESKMNAIDNKTIDASVSLTGDDKIAALESKMNAIDNKVINASVSLAGDDKIAALESKMNAIDNKVINASVSIQNSQAVTNLQNALANIQSKQISVIVNTSVNSAAVDAYQPAPKEGTVTYKVDSSQVDAWSPPSKSGTVSYGISASSGVYSWTPPTKYGTIRYSAVVEGPNSANGTAHADGTANTGKAFKQGKWGTKESGTALMGELGPEIIVRGDKWFTVGDNGAGFYQYKKGDIIFNHLQSEELLKNGYVTSNGGRGRAFAEGTAFASVSGGGGFAKPWGGGSSSSGTTTVVNNTTNNYNYGSSKKSSGGSKSSSKAKKEADEFKESLDLIEIMIDRIERAIDSLDRTASSSFRSFSDRNNALTQQMQKVREEMSLQQQAYERYLQQAYNSGLSNDWANRIINGEINVELITDENLKDQIDDFQEWYEKALDAKDSFEDLNETLGELSSQRFENIQEQFEGILDSLGYEQSMVENYVDRAEVDGQFVSKNFYKFLQDNVHAQAEALREELKQLIQARDDAVNAGTVAIGGAEWNEMNKDINDVTVSIHELGTQWAEYAKAMRETEWDIFDTIQDRISGIADEAQFLIDLMSNKKLFEDSGQLTDEGMATIGLYGEQYNILMNQADRYAEEIKKLEEQMAKEPFGPDAYGNASNAFNQDIIDRYYELIEAQQEAILSAEDMKNAIKDMVSEGIDLELEHLDDLIDKYLEALQAQKD